MNSTVVCRWPGRAIRSTRGRWLWFFWVWMMLAVWSSLHISKNTEQKCCGRGGMREEFVQHPLVSPSLVVDMRMVFGLHDITVESKASKTFNYLRSNINTSMKQNPTPFCKLFYNLFNFLGIWPWDLSPSVMVPEYAEELSAAVGRCNHKDLGSPRGGALGEQSQNSSSAQAPQQVLFRTPQHRGCRSSKIQWVTLIVLYFYIGESSNPSKTEGYEIFWVICPVSTVFEDLKTQLKNWRLLVFKMREIFVFRKDTGGCLGLLLFKSVWERDTVWPRDVTGQKNLCISDTLSAYTSGMEKAKRI